MNSGPCLTLTLGEGFWLLSGGSCERTSPCWGRAANSLKNYKLDVMNQIVLIHAPRREDPQGSFQSSRLSWLRGYTTEEWSHTLWQLLPMPSSKHWCSDVCVDHAFLGSYLAMFYWTISALATFPLKENCSSYDILTCSNSDNCPHLRWKACPLLSHPDKHKLPKTVTAITQQCTTLQVFCFKSLMCWFWKHTCEGLGWKGCWSLMCWRSSYSQYLIRIRWEP